ncbi:MAG: NAD(P)/FAD-dependent oxidoreductase [Pseudomonadota bacterium]
MPKTLIIGGGLSGLALAERLQTLGSDFLLLEARERFGGRIMAEHVGASSFDMGPAWFWPGQPRLDALVTRLDLARFDQYASGDLMYEDDTGRVHRGRGFASMAGSWRLDGGFSALTNALAERLSPEAAHLNATVVGISLRDQVCVAQLDDGTEFDADRIVLAMPPRIAANINFAPALPEQAARAMVAVPTWMAGQAKIVAVYPTPFWRDAGLSGDATSRRGPLVEIHDASPATGGPYALFGFVGIPPAARADEDALRQAAQAQLVRLFGDKAANPEALFVKDWAFDPLTATELDQGGPLSHPAYGLPAALSGLWEARLIFAGAEVGSRFGGYAEGALEAADAAIEDLQGTVSASAER